MASFQAKIGWKMPRKRKNKNYRSVPFLHDAKQKIPKKQKKNTKIPLWHHFKPKQVGKCRESENIKSIVPLRSNPTRNTKIQKNSKILKMPLWLHFKPK